MKMLSLFLLSTIFSTSLSFAGQEKGGGVIFVCKSRVWGILPETSFYLADSHSLKKAPIYYELQRLQFSNPDRALDDAIQLIKKKNEIVGRALAESMKELHFSEGPDLPLLGNDGIENPPKGCSKKQLAVQTFATGLVEVSKRLRKKLTQMDDLLFKLHEAYLRVLWKSGQNDPSVKEVREQVFNWAQDPQFVEFLEASPARVIPEPSGACFLPTVGFRACALMRKSVCLSVCENLGNGMIVPAPPGVDVPPVKICGSFIGGPCGM